MDEVRTGIEIDTEVSGAQQLYQLSDAMAYLTKKLQELTASAADVSAYEKLYGEINQTLDAVNKFRSGLDIQSKQYWEFEEPIKQLEGLKNWVEKDINVLNEFHDKARTPVGVNISEVEEKYKQVTDTVREGTEQGTVNNDKLIKSLLGIAESGNISTGSIKSLAQALGASAPEIAAVGLASAGLIKYFKETYKATEDVLGAIEKLTLDMGKLMLNLGSATFTGFIDGVQTLGDGFVDLLQKCDTVIDKLQEFSDMGSEIQGSYFKIYEYLGKDAGQDIINYGQKLASLYNIDSSSFMKGMKGILAVTSQLGLDADGVTKYSKALNNLALDLSAFSGESVEEIAKQYENAINLGVLNSRSSIAKAFDLTDSDIDQFKKLNTEIERTNFLLLKGEGIQGMYADYMDTAAGKVTQLKNAYSNFLNTVGQLALQLYSIVAPVLTKIINLATYAVNVLAKLLHLDLSGDKGLSGAFSNKAADKVGRYADNIGKVGDSIKDTGNKAKEASRKVASFDDVIQINEDKSSKNKDDSNIADLVKDLENYDPSSWLDDFATSSDDLDFSLDNLKDMLKNLLNEFKNWEEGLDWAGIRAAARGLGEDLADLLNVIVDDERAWQDFGNLVGNTLNTLFEFMDGFATKFHFGQFGKDIGVAFDELFRSLDEKLVADTIYHWLSGAMDMAIGFFSVHPFSNMSWSLSDIIVKLIDNMSSVDFTIKINELINAIFEDFNMGINQSLDKFERHGTLEKLGGIINNIFVKIGENFPKTVKTVSRLIVAGLDLLGTAISNAITGFFTGLDKDPDAINSLVDSIINIVNAVFSNIGTIGEALAEHKDDIVALIQGLISKVSENAEGWGQDLQPLVDTLITALKAVDTSKLGDALRTILENAHIDELISEYLGLKLRAKWEKFKTEFGMAWNVFWQNVLGGLKTIGWALVAVVVTILDAMLTTFTFGLNKVIVAIVQNWDTIKASFDQFMSDIGIKWDAFWDGLSAKAGEIKDNINNFFFDLDKNWDNTKKKLGEGIQGKWEDFKKGWTESVTAVTKVLHDFFEKIKSFWSNLKQGFKDVINFIIDGLNRIQITIPDWVPEIGGKSWKINIPKLAVGGIVERQTLAQIGEDGKEAVLPLEKNTGWMDQLATRLAAQINSGAAANGGVININIGNKSMYTRSEMLDFADQVVQALRVYGVNVSVAY